MLAMVCGACASHPKGWKMVWHDEFNGKTLDTTVWSRIPRGTSDWQNTQSFDDRCYEMRKGHIVLKGIVNDDLKADTAHYLTGGIWTKDKHAFEGGRVEIRARLHGAKGAWPAIWMMAFDTKAKPWPDCGEIDLMERLNHDSIAYQTVHSHYTHTLGIKNPPQGSTGPIDPEGYNVYGVDFHPDSIVLHINGKPTLTYPRIETDKPGQFPFYVPQYLLIDMQLGGSWVGQPDGSGLPVEMEVDWVRHYRRR